jgi:hypothetical protein
VPWEQLVSITREAAEERRAQFAAKPKACPNDGQPLVDGPHGTLVCLFDGYQWPRDDQSPSL